MMRWKLVMLGLALMIAGAVGCKQQCFIHECDYNHYAEVGLPPRLECDPQASVEPVTAAIPTPTTVFDPERQLRYLTLTEAIALAIENGEEGQLSLLGGNAGVLNLQRGSSSNDFNLPSFTGRGITTPDAIRVLALDPAIIGADVESSLAKFDAIWNTSMTWNSTDQPFNGTNFFNNQSNGANFSTGILKPLPTGGVTGITFSTAYQFLNNARAIAGITPTNPSYTPRLQFQFEQPLLQGYGVEINQLRSTHPGSVLSNIPVGGRVEGILISRMRFDMQRAEFARHVHNMVLNVEHLYWTLFGSYWDLYAREQALRQSFESWKINKARFQVGRIPIQDFAQTRQQYEQFRSLRLNSLYQVMDNERQLRALIGLPIEDGTRLVPIDAPTLTPYAPDWSMAVNECLAQRPELVLARDDLKVRQLELINTKNLLLPDLRFTSTYGLSGIGTRLDGADDNNALRNLASDKFTDWTLGLRMAYTIGYRDAHAQTRIARLNLARSYKSLQDFEQKAIRSLEVAYRNLFAFHEMIQIQHSQRLAAAEQLEARTKEYAAGKGTLDILLESQRVWSQALSDEYAAISNYNNSLADFEYAKGTILNYDSIVIGEGPLPQCAQVRAVEHERERAKALVLRERADPITNQTCDYEKGNPGLPNLPQGVAAPVGSLPVQNLFEERPSLPPIPSRSPTTASPIPTENAPTPPNTTGKFPSEMPRTLPLEMPAGDKTLPSWPTTIRSRQ